MAHFKPFARAKSGAPSHRDDDDERDYDDDDDDERSERRYRRRGNRNTGLIVIDLGL